MIYTFKSISRGLNTIIMTLQKAIEILAIYQRWRLGSDDEPPKPKEITEAIDIAIRLMSQLN